MARIMSLNYSRQGKPRRLWRLAVATQSTIAENWYKVTYYRCVSIPSGNYMGEPTLKSKACLKCLYFTIIIFDLCRYLEYFSYLYTINQTE